MKDRIAGRERTEYIRYGNPRRLRFSLGELVQQRVPLWLIVDEGFGFPIP